MANPPINADGPRVGSAADGSTNKTKRRLP